MDEKNAVSNWVFRFKYKTTSCNGTAIGGYVSYNGAHFRSAWLNTDFALLELRNRSITNDSSITFLGWDRTTATPTSGVGIHHPAGDVMKISIEGDDFGSDTWAHSTETHWRVNFDSGIVEPGSSGSPILNQAGRVTGNLSGGKGLGINPIYCNHPRAYYGKFDQSWAGGGTRETRLSDWLDPRGKDIMTTNTISSSISGPQVVANAGSTYTVTSAAGSPQNVTWLCSSNLQITSSSNTSASVRTLAYGSGWIRAVVDGYSTKRHDVWNGTPPVINIISPSSAPPGYVRFEAECYELSGANYFEWKVNPTEGSYVRDNSRITDIYFYDDGLYQVMVRAYNANGAGEYCTTNIRVTQGIGASGYSHVYYPNPVSDVLFVGFSLTADGLESSKSSGSTEQSREFFEIYLYSQQGTLLKKARSKGETIEFDVANFPDGFYYLHIKEPGDAKVKKHQVIVKH